VSIRHRIAISSWFLFSSLIFAKQITTNNIEFNNAPDWLTQSQLETATGTIQNYLEWDMIRIKAYYHTDVKQYDALTKLNFTSDAFFNRNDSTIHLSPRVNRDNFGRIFGHELVHAIFFQKYKGAIPPWLEEGLANYIGKKSSPDYVWLAAQPRVDVKTLTHPQSDTSGSQYHYAASTALIEMIASRCSLPDLLQLSVGKKLETYLGTYCEISDINAAFKDWLNKKSKEQSRKQKTR
jgi:hypothetical protein